MLTQIVALIGFTCCLMAALVFAQAPDEIVLLLWLYLFVEVLLSLIDLAHKRVGALFHGDYWWESPYG